jgi:hypothetical protein
MASDVDKRTLEEEWYDEKSSLMESMLGKQHDIVMHAIVPYAFGGPLDLYYYPGGVPGTAVATKELCQRPNKGPSNKLFPSYELVMFTRHELALGASGESVFGRAHETMSQVLNVMARYSQTATLNSKETACFSLEIEHVGGKCFIFDAYASRASKYAQRFGLLATIEIFGSEMAFARERGGEKLIALLKASGVYPYSDMDRAPVA